MVACKSHSHSSTASFKVTRPTPISITSAIAWSESFSVSSLPDLFSNTSGPSGLESNRQTQNEIVDLSVQRIGSLRMCAARDGDNDKAAHPNDRRERSE